MLLCCLQHPGPHTRSPRTQLERPQNINSCARLFGPVIRIPSTLSSSYIRTTPNRCWATSDISLLKQESPCWNPPCFVRTHILAGSNLVRYVDHTTVSLTVFLDIFYSGYSKQNLRNSICNFATNQALHQYRTSLT